MANNIDLTISALECPLGTFQCSGRLIFRLRTESAFQAAPVFRMAYSAPTAHCAVSSETLMLQPLRGLRTPHRSIVSSPLAAAAALWLPCVRGAVRRSGLRGCPLGVGGKGKGPAVPFPSLRTEPALRAAPVFRSAYSASRNAPASAASRPPSEHTVLFLPKRSCFRFASLTLRTPHRPIVSSTLAAAAALWLPCVRGAVRRRAGLRGCLRIRGKGKGRRPSPVSAPNRLFELLRCFARLIRQAETLDLQPLRGLHRSTLRCLL